MIDNAKDRQTMTYRHLTLLPQGNGKVTELCLTFVYRWLLLPKRKAKQKTLPTHYQSVVLVWLILAFLSDFYFSKGISSIGFQNTIFQSFILLLES